MIIFVSNKRQWISVWAFSYEYHLSYFFTGEIGCDYGFIYSMFSYDLFAFNVLTV